ncbi:Structural maintenance of chromosomes protein 6, variant 2 [Orbilia brochopaga]|uniref:Structural maintenance of chromosomes protein 6, variant 2 n=1 Tax=Orbilia brochopaga TaxID=3140254 RepID=A0AAV9URZ9_9PEZI
MRSTKRARIANQPDNPESARLEEHARSSKKQKTNASEPDPTIDEPGTDSDEDAIYFEQSQRLVTSTLNPRENEPADYGTIELIRLENFMCHSCLEMKFGPFMNFVVGQNGSGKSAVLTALTLCLGAKAAVTNRGGNIKSFIKEGEHMAAVEVHLRNRGDGFRKEVYGDTVIVQRTFNRDGVNSYKTKSKSGKTISTSKKELSDIIDYMSLQVDNPMTVLSQDLARQFLSNSSDEDKYKFFMKGVQLDDLYALYQNLKGQQSVIESVLESKDEDIRELEEDKEKAEKRFRMLKETENLRHNVRDLLLKLAWAQVADKEKLLDTIKNEIAGLEQAQLELQKTSEDVEKDIKTWDQKVEEAQAAVRSSSESNSPLNEKRKELEEKLNTEAEKLARVQQSERTADQQMKAIKARIDKAKRDAEAEKERLADAEGGKHASLLKEKEQLIEKKSQLSREQSELETSLETEATTVSSTTAKAHAAIDALKRKERDLQTAKETLQNLTSGHSNNLSVYGQNTQVLLKSIEKSKWKARMPIGPVGLLVKLKYQNWSSILEKQLSRVLSGFVAFSLEDKDQLMNLVHENGCDHSVFYSSPNSFRLKEPADGYLTIMRALEIENEDVRRTLVTTYNIEQTILVEDHVEARRTMEACPENVKGCYSLNRQRRGNGFSIRMGQGSGGVDPIIGHTGPSRIATNVEEQIRVAQENVNALEGDLSNEQSKYNVLRHAVEISKNKIQQYTTKKHTLRTDIQRIEDKLEELVGKLQQNNTETQLGKLESAIEVHEDSYKKYVGQQQDIANDKQRHIAMENELKSQIETLRSQINESESQTKVLQAAHSSAIQQRERAVLKQSELLQKLHQQKISISDREARMTEIEQGLPGMKKEAEEVGPRVNLRTKETAAEMESRLEQLNSQLEKRDARIGASTEQIAKDFADKTEKYNEAGKEREDLKNLHKALNRAFEERMERWFYFRKHISVQSRLQFHLLMSEREFDGKLVFDHTNGILQLKVQPTQQATDTQRNAKTLSGGEKSFSQICLLLALWEAMGSPFRCLDEFDVFMDAVNRGVSMGLIVYSQSFKEILSV